MAAGFQVDLIDPISEVLRDVATLGVRVFQKCARQHERTPPVDLDFDQAEMVGADLDRPYGKSLQLKGEVKPLL